MDSIDYGHSMKNIPTHSKLTYLYKLIGKVEKVLKSMRWKALFFDRDQANSNTNVNSNVQHPHKHLQSKNKKVTTTNFGYERT